MAVIKIKEGTRESLSNGWEKSYTLRLYKNTVAPTEDSVLVDFTEATGTNYIEKTLLWSDATVTWTGTQYQALWPEQSWSSISSLDATGIYIEDGTYAYSFEGYSFGEDYTTLSVTPKIVMG